MTSKDTSLGPWQRVAVVVASVLTLAACGPDGSAGSPTGPTASPTGPASPAASGTITPAPSTAGASASVPVEEVPLAIEVVEAGFTAFPGGDGGLVSYAALLHNPNTGWALQRAEVLVDFLDADGAFVGGEELLVTILPGQTTAITGQSSGAAAATQIVVRPPEDQTAFVQRPATAGGFDVVGVGTEATAGGWLTTGTLVSRFEEAQTFVQLFAVHRDAGAAIVGGGAGGVEAIGPGTSVDFEIVDASAYAEVAATDVYWQVTR